MIDPVERLTWNLEEVCEVLGVNGNIIREWTNRADHPLPHIQTRRNGRVIYPRESVRQWLIDESTAAIRPITVTELYKAAANTAKRVGIRSRT